MRCIGYCYYPHMLPTEYHMLCELKQAVLLLEQEFTPAEIRIGRGNPSWVVETGTPTFDSIAKLWDLKCVRNSV